jgi:hypothetical protein
MLCASVGTVRVGNISRGDTVYVQDSIIPPLIRETVPLQVEEPAAGVRSNFKLVDYILSHEELFI